MPRPDTPLWFVESVLSDPSARRPVSSPYGPGEHGYRILIMSADHHLRVVATFRPDGRGCVATAAQAVLEAFQYHDAWSGLVYDRTIHEHLFTVTTRDSHAQRRSSSAAIRDPKDPA